MPVPHHPISDVNTGNREDCNGSLVLGAINFNAFDQAARGPGLRCAYPGYSLPQLADGRASFARGNPG
jgi:hypothetical protein